VKLAKYEESMSHFDDLRHSYSQWRKAQMNYQQSSVSFTHAFANRFRDFIGAPESFTDHESGKQVRYVAALAADKNHEGEYVVKSADSPFDILYYDDEDSFWVTGIGLTLDIDANIYPKTRFFLPASFYFSG